MKITKMNYPNSFNITDWQKFYINFFFLNHNYVGELSAIKLSKRTFLFHHR